MSVENKIKQSRPFWLKQRSVFLSNEAELLLAKTHNLEPIARYFLIDACLSSKYKVTLEQCLKQWEIELQYANLVDQDVKNFAKSQPNVPRFYLCCRFAIGILKNLLFRGMGKTMINYNLHARNFFIGLLLTQSCVCISYTLYVTALVNHFGYSDGVSECNLPGHIFTYMTQDSTFSIGIDAGYFHNNHIDVNIYGQSFYSQEQLYLILNWDLHLFQQKHHKLDELPSCSLEYYFGHKKTSLARLAGNLWVETGTKNHFETFIRNQFILETILEDETKKQEHDEQDDDEKNFVISLQYAQFTTVYHILEKHGLDFLFTPPSSSSTKNSMKTRMAVVAKYNQLKPILQNNGHVEPISLGKWDKSLWIQRGIFELMESYFQQSWFHLEYLEPFLKVNQEYQNLVKNNMENVKLISLYGALKPEAGSAIKTFLVTAIYELSDTFHSLGFFQISIINIKDIFQLKIALSKLPEAGITIYVHVNDKIKLPQHLVSFPRTKMIHTLQKWIPGLIIITYDFPHTQYFLNQVKDAQDLIMDQPKLFEKLESLRASIQSHEDSHHGKYRTLRLGLTYNDFVNDFALFLLQKPSHPLVEKTLEEDLQAQIPQIYKDSTKKKSVQ